MGVIAHLDAQKVRPDLGRRKLFAGCTILTVDATQVRAPRGPLPLAFARYLVPH